jgi:cell division septal protein FtsQ
MSYRSKHVKNKVHKIKPRKSIFRRPVFWYSILVLIIASACAYFFFFYPDFQVKNIIISGNEKINTKDIENLAWSQVSKKIFGIFEWNVFTKSIFLVDTGKINKEILEKFPAVESAKIDKNFPDKLMLGLTERKPVGVFCDNNNDCFLIDGNGVVFEPSGGAAGTFITIRRASENSQIFAGEDVVNKNIMDAISKIEKNLKDNFQIDMQEAMLSNPFRLDIKTAENWEIYFGMDSNSNINLQLTKLDLLLQKQIPPAERKNLQYIDLRFKDRAYYK